MNTVFIIQILEGGTKAIYTMVFVFLLVVVNVLLMMTLDFIYGTKKAKKREY